MMRKIFVLLFLLMIGVIGMTYLYFSNLNKEASASGSSLNAVSAVAPLIFTFENDKGFYDILSGQGLTDNCLGEEKSKLLSSIRSYVSKNKIQNLIDGERIVIGFLAGEDKNTLDFLIATQTADTQIDLALLSRPGISISKSGNFNEVKIGDSTTFFLSVNGKSILLSNKLSTLEKAAKIEKGQKNNFLNYIKQNIQANKNTLANVYIDFSKLPSILKNILNTNLTGELQVLNQQQTYASLSYNFGSDKFLLNGYTDVQESENYFKLFIDQKEQKITIDQLFPSQTANYTIFTVNDYQKWSTDLAKLQKQQKEYTKIENQRQSINDKYRINIKNTFPQYFNKQFAVLQLKSGEKMGIIEIKNGDKLGQLLLDLSSEYAPDIRIFKEANLMASFFGEPFKRFERPFYTIIDNHFVIASYASTIQVFLNSYKNDQLLVSTDGYSHFKDQTSSSSTIAFYINSKNSNEIFGRNLKAPFYKQYQSKNGFKDYNAFGYQLSADNGKLMSNIFLLKNQTKTELDSLKIK